MHPAYDYPTNQDIPFIVASKRNRSPYGQIAYDTMKIFFMTPPVILGFICGFYWHCFMRGFHKTQD